MTARKWLKVWGTCERVLPCDRVTKYVDVYMCGCVCTCMPWGNKWVCLLCVWMYMCPLSGSMFMCTSISVPPLKSCHPETWAKGRESFNQQVKCTLKKKKALATASCLCPSPWPAGVSGTTKEPGLLWLPFRRSKSPEKERTNQFNTLFADSRLSSCSHN